MQHFQPALFPDSRKKICLSGAALQFLETGLEAP